ncbi:5'/3'-nucleotidase SurE [Vineibacter terrae]|uniref:5'-nucleotidase SurE n=1 Tax=Vineibacter terrae TaxID=2586908 RepID=A0A5C8PDQ9_9HYPH|nr:5'/3'-nucleotidase SurE [Vineibacter terrae]TXL71520.1 5'/3'-nucleotidase SurE [Vineibacter terrae]HEX2890193.1 5'/3'-nucleotidase SurE [Vineibacter terrae]
MAFPPLDPAKARILVTNDDGINAPGLVSLFEIARALSSDVWVVAPETNQSGAAHSLSLSKPLRAREVSEGKWAVDGTPTDCVLFAVRHLMGDKPPTLVLSGVNRGTNLADDVTYSGTIAAAMEGCLLGIRSIAMSQAYAHPNPVKWETAERHGADVVRRVLAVDWSNEALINVNFPDVDADAVTGMEVTRQGQRGFGGHILERLDPRGTPYYWINYTPTEKDLVPGTDIEALRRGAISINPLHLDLTHETMRRRLREAFSRK